MASQWCAGHTFPNTHWVGHSNFPSDVDAQAGNAPNTLNLKSFLSSLDICLQSTSVPGTVWGLCQRWNLRDPRQCHQKVQGLEVPCRLGCRYLKWEPSRAQQAGTVTDSSVTSVYIVMEFRTPSQDPTSHPRRKQDTHKESGIEMVSDCSITRS